MEIRSIGPQFQIPENNKTKAQDPQKFGKNSISNAKEDVYDLDVVVSSPQNVNVKDQTNTNNNCSGNCTGYGSCGQCYSNNC